MSKTNQPTQATVFCGIDVSAATLNAAVQQEDHRFEERIFDNSASGHKALIAWLLKRSPVMLPIPGTSKVSHLEQNMGAAQIQLSADEFASLDRAHLEK